ncbi:hypothetical protein OZX62_07380 [Bifidobacterium sp. ESL0690]|uniref:hypothetical protein n=1 Tax=Bifidobacterium sp. ESL0690 TaxID=2983214 RepID=UPI0023F6AC76|nr:hypothetical protein [Bifidobacterium sp. ESL0690]WEV46259.1 hypothetical protein OZX62_07380 [Bifidobacterium sp. ESL0690]
MMDEGFLPSGGAAGSSSRVLGPFRFVLGYREFKELFRAENGVYMRKIGLIGTVCAGWAIPASFIGGIVPMLRGRIEWTVSNVAGNFGAFLIGCFFVWCLVRPPFLFVFRSGKARSFFRFHGARVPEGADPRGLSVSVSTSLCALGGQEVAADGTLVRTPFAFMRRWPVVSRRFVFLPVADWRSDSAVWNMVGVNWAFRPEWDGEGVALPRSGVRDAWRLLWEVHGRVREASKRYRRAKRLASRGVRDPSARAEALALMRPELEWLAEGERLNQQHERQADGDVASDEEER